MTDLSGVGSMMNGDVSGMNLFDVDDRYCDTDVGDSLKMLTSESQCDRKIMLTLCQFSKGHQYIKLVTYLVNNIFGVQHPSPTLT